jgi:hypothetical protein
MVPASSKIGRPARSFVKILTRMPNITYSIANDYSMPAPIEWMYSAILFLP